MVKAELEALTAKDQQHILTAGPSGLFADGDQHSPLVSGILSGPMAQPNSSFRESQVMSLFLPCSCSFVRGLSISSGISIFLLLTITLWSRSPPKQTTKKQPVSLNKALNGRLLSKGRVLKAWKKIRS